MNAQPNLGMQVTTFENPMGIDGFEFVEFAAPAGQGEALHDYFRRLGFTAVLRHKTRPITVYRQGAVNFLVNEDPDSFAADFARAHGPSACGFAIRFRKPGSEVLKTVLGNGGEGIGIFVDQEVDPALAVNGDGPGLVVHYRGESHLAEIVVQQLALTLWSGEFDEFEAVDTHRIFERGDLHAKIGLCAHGSYLAGLYL